MSNKKKKEHKKKIEALKGIKGEIRKQHFEAGGSAKEWIGTGGVHKNPAEKRQNRRTKRNRAIKDSEDE